MIRRNLVVFTHGAPFANGENAFLFPELPMLAETFERVVLVPDMIRHAYSRREVQLPDHVEVYSERYFKRRTRNAALIRAFTSFKWVRDIKRIKRPSDFITCLLDIDSVISFQGMFQMLLSDLSLDLRDTVFYTFWMTHEASGLAELSLKHENLSFVSRAHGYDLYDYRTNFRSRYFRELTINQSKGIFCCSKNGAAYLETNYSCESGKIKVGYLGIECDGVEPAIFTDDATCLRLITVANLVPIKRHVKFVGLLSEYAQAHTELEISYDIIGDGYYRQHVETACHNLPKNLCVTLYGAMSNKEVLQRYNLVPYDLFVLPSESEGLSVAVMEAMVRGIPAMVTNVGGMSELVRNGDTGYLLKKEFNVVDVSEALDRYRESSRTTIRSAARRYVNSEFDRDVLRRDYVKELSSV